MENIAINFLIWCADNGWYRNGKQDEWYRLTDSKNTKTATELFEIFKNNK